jgi:pimeloyl-ACP methyl ester carboxylesterase
MPQSTSVFPPSSTQKGEFTYTPFSVSFTTKTNLVISSKYWTNNAASSNVADKSSTPLRILALHGWLDNCASFDLLVPFILHLTDSAVPPIPTTIVAIDLAGHGLSSHRDSYLFVNGLNDISDIADILGWKTFSLLGHSLGAGFSSFFAGIYPEKLVNIGLIDGFAPFPLSPSQTPMKTREHLDAMASLPYKSKPMYLSPQEAIMARVNHSELPLTEFAAKKIVDRGLKPVFTSVNGHQVMRYTWRSDPKLRVPSPMYYTPEALSSILGKVSCPVAWFIATHGIWYQAAREQEAVDATFC